MSHKIRYKIRLLYRKLLIKVEELIFILPDFIRFIFSAKVIKHDLCIIFVGTVMHARIARMAKWLSQLTDYQLILICSSTGYSSKLSGDYFNQVLTYRNTWDLKRKLSHFDFNKNVFHLFAPPYKGAYTAVSFIKHAKKLFDFQDLIVTNFGLNPPFAYMKKELKMEKFVLKNVDGIINHSLELQTAKKYYGTIEAKKMFFPNYTDSDHFMYKSKKLNDEIHIVFIGSVHSAYRSRDYFGGGMLHWLIEKLNKQEIHFHIYPAPSNLKEHLVDYFKLNEKLPYFHLHDSVNQEELSKEIHQYDFGVLPFFNRTNKKLNDKRRFSTTLKMFNFFEAGLPVIVSEDVCFQNYICRKFGADIKARWDDFDDIRKLVNKYNYNDLVSSIEKNRERLSIKNQLYRLTDFYKD